MTEHELLDLEEGNLIIEIATGRRYEVRHRYARLVAVTPCIDDDTLILGAEHAPQWTPEEKKP